MANQTIPAIQVKDSNVGIGTTTPNIGNRAGSGTLTIKNSSTYAEIEISGSSSTQGGVISFYGDTTKYAEMTGEYTSANNGMMIWRTRVSNSITENMRLTGGNLGIGTTSPIQPLTVSAVANASTIALLGRASDNASRIDFYNNAGNSRLYTVALGNSAVEHYADANIPMVFSTNAAERMRITAAGNIGINNSAPASILDVISGATQIADFRSTVVDGLTNIRIVNDQQTTSTGTSPAAIELVAKRGTSTHGRHAWIGAEGVDGTTFRTQIKFKIRPEDSAYQWSTLPTQMVIDGNGSVGINNASPSYTLDVYATDTPVVRIQSQNSGGVGNPRLLMSRGGEDTFQINVEPNVGVNLKAVVANAGYMDFYTGTDAVTMRVSSSKNLLIGTTTDSGYKLRVAGTSYFDGLAHFGQASGNGSAFRWGPFGTAVSDDTMLCMNQLWNGSGWTILNSGVGTTYLNLGGGVASPDIQFGTGPANTAATTKMIIKNGGNVGIGTTSPSSHLHVAASSDAQFLLSSNNFVSIYQDAAWESNMLFGARFDGTNEVYGATGRGAFKIEVLHDGNASPQYMAFYGADSGTAGNAITWNTVGFAQDEDGNVGVGILSPASKLHVYSGASSSTAAANAIAIFEGGGNGVIQVNGPDANSMGLFFGRNGAAYYSGIERDGTNLYLKNNSSVAISINSSGQVGVGSTSVYHSSKLSVAGKVHFQTSSNTDIGGAIYSTWTQSANGSDYYAGDLRFQIFNASTGTYGLREAMMIDGKGFVGIGTTSPSSIFHISTTGANAYSGTITKGSNMKGIVNTLSNNADDMVGIYFATGTNDAGSHWSGITGSRSQSAVDWSTQLNFYTHDENTSNINDATQKMVIKGSGKVGIGTTAPTKTLHVYTTGNEGIFLQGTGGGVWMDVQSTGSELWSYGCETGGAGIYNRTDSTYRFYVNNDGKVGIGTTSPSQKLQVDGTVITTSTLNSTHGSYSIDHPGVNTWKIGVTSTNSSTFHIGNDSGGSFANKIFSITGGGSVGIGTTEPGAKLDISGGYIRLQEMSNKANGWSVYNGSGHLSSRITTNGHARGWGWEFTDNYPDSATQGVYFRVGYNGAVSYLTSGNFGIGTTAPSQKLHVVGAVVGGNTATTGLPNTSGVTTQLAFEARSTQFGNDPSIAYHKEAVYTMYLQGQNSPRGLRLYSPTGETTANFYVQGDVVAFSSSDRRLKDNLSPIPNALEKVSKLTGYEFDWNENQSAYTGHDYGVVAQEVEAVMPELVQTREDGYKAVKYDKIVAVLIEAIKEQQKQIDELKSKLK